MIKKIFVIIIILACCTAVNFIDPVSARLPVSGLAGRILLQVESKGEAWYINGEDERKYHLKNEKAVLKLVQQLGVGISDENLNKIPIGFENFHLLKNKDSDSDGLPDNLEDSIGTSPISRDTDHDGYSDFIEVSSDHDPKVHFDQKKDKIIDVSLINGLKGKFVIQTENRGQAWYVHPFSGKKYYLAEPKSAFETLKLFASGASNEVLNQIKTGILTKQRVIKVIDGDTIQLEGGQIVRYIGIDAPEIDYPDCFGNEALEMNRKLVENKEVELIRDVSDTDKHGRYLAYVFVDGIFVNEFLIQNGYAFALTYAPDIKYSNIFSELQRKAKFEHKGLWKKCFINN